MNLSIEEKAVLLDFFNRRKKVNADLSASDWKNKLFSCPGCGFPTLEIESQGYEICTVCGWEDDGQDDNDADEVLGGPNGDLSLTRNRINISKELNELAIKLNGKITTDLNKMISALALQRERMKKVGIKGDTLGTDPLWDRWRDEREKIKVYLIEINT